MQRFYHCTAPLALLSVWGAGSDVRCGCVRLGQAQADGAALPPPDDQPTFLKSCHLVNIFLASGPTEDSVYKYI